MRALILGLLLCSALFSCKKAEERACAKSVGERISETRTSSDVHSLRLFDGIHYDLYQDSLDKVVIHCGKNLVGLVDTEINDGILTITDGNKCSWLRELPADIRIEIHYTSLDYVYLEGYGDVAMKTPHVGEELRWDSWHVNTKCSLEVDVQRLFVSSNGGGTETLVKGSTQEVYFHFDGLGIMDARQLTAQYTWGNNLNSGFLQVNFPSGGRFDYLIQSYGDISYQGEPDSLQMIAHTGEGQLLRE